MGEGEGERDESKREREWERERERERHRGWGRVRYRDQAIERDRVSSKGYSQRVNPGNTGRHQHNSISNWRDQRDISSFYFTRFSDDITEKELWSHFKKKERKPRPKVVLSL